MNTPFFVVYILVLTLGVTHFYAEVRELFSPVKSYQQKVTRLEQKLKRERFNHLLISYEFADFRTHVATILPQAIDEKGPGEKSFPLRSLASVVQKTESEKLAVVRSKALFEEGKKLFRDKKYQEAVRALTLLINKHSYSAHVPEALFLLVEANYILRDHEDCVHYANKLLDLYPEDELTGCAMLRLGKVYEEQERFDDAIEIYQTVMKVFPQRGLASVAQQALKSVEL